LRALGEKMKKKFRIIDVGPTTEETVEIHYKMYADIINYRGGKTLRECVDEANDPSRWRKNENKSRWWRNFG